MSDLGLEESDSLLVDNIMSQMATDNEFAWRFKTIVNMNPYMANNPNAVMAMAGMSIDNDQLLRNAGALYGMQAANDLVTRLPGYQPSTQRAIFAGLTPAQQESLALLGYSTPSSDVHSESWFGDLLNTAFKPIRAVTGGAGKFLAPVVNPALDALITIGDMPFKAYRTIKQLDSVDQWIALAAGTAGVVGGVALLPFTGGTSSALATLGFATITGTLAASAASFTSSSLRNGSPSIWINAWKNAWNGERLFSEPGRAEARKLLGDSALLAFAQEIASELDPSQTLYSLAEQIAGVRDGQRQDVQVAQLSKIASRYGEVGSTNYTDAYRLLSDLMTEPVFKEAVDVLANSKISIGRDIARSLGLNPSEGAGRWISGGVDAASIILVDPFMFAGGLRQTFRMAKYGLHFDDIALADRFAQVAQLPTVKRKMDLVADAVRTGKADLLDRGAKEYRQIYLDLRAHMTLRWANDAANAGKTFGGNDVVEWLIGNVGFKNIMSGIGIAKGLNFGMVKGMGATEYYLRRASMPVRNFLNGIEDLRIERNIAKMFDDPELGPALFDHLSSVSDEVVDRLIPLVGDERTARAVARLAMNQPVQELFDIGATSPTFARILGNDNAAANRFISRLATDDRLGYQVGRIIGSIPIARIPFQGAASFISGITTRVPGAAIALIGKEAVDDITNYVDLFRGYMPSYVRTEWKNAIFNTSPFDGGARFQAVMSLLDSTSTAFGMRLSQEGSELLDNFLYQYEKTYSFGEAGRVQTYFNDNLFIPASPLPIKDMAMYMPVPDLKTLRRAVREHKVIEYLTGTNPHILALQNRYWKPAVLLRLGFIFRNVGEEMLGFVTRYGVGRMWQESAARGIAQRDAYKEAQKIAETVGKRQSITEFDRWVQRARWDIPAVMRPVARTIDALGRSGRPMVRTIVGHMEWMDNLLRSSGERVRGVYEAGFGFLDGLGRWTDFKMPAQAGSRKILSVDNAKANLQNFWRQLAFGNQYSFRRMLIGGVDSQLAKHAQQFERHYLKQIMDQVGTSNQAPWQRMGGQNAVNRVVQTDRGEEIVLVNELSVRQVATRDNPLPMQQPWSEATLRRRQEIMDDFVAATGADVARLIHNADVQAELPADVLKSVLSDLNTWMFDDGVVAADLDILQLWFATNGGKWNREYFDAVLRRMEVDVDRIVEEFASDTVLRQWAVSRNEFVSKMRQAFPGQTRPTWDQIRQLIDDNDELFQLPWTKLNQNVLFLTPEQAAIPDVGAGRFNPVRLNVSENVYRIDESLQAPASVVKIQTETVEGKRFSSSADQIALLGRLQDQLGSVSQDGMDWLNQVIIGWLDKPTLIDGEVLTAWDVAAGYADSPFFESWLDAKDAIAAAMRDVYEQKLTDPSLAELLNLNLRNVPSSSTDVYLLDSKALADALGISQIEVSPTIFEDFANEVAIALAAGQVSGGYGLVDAESRKAFTEWFASGLAGRSPLIIDDEEAALLLNDVIWAEMRRRVSDLAGLGDEAADFAASDILDLLSAKTFQVKKAVVPTVASDVPLGTETLIPKALGLDTSAFGRGDFKLGIRQPNGEVRDRSFGYITLDQTRLTEQDFASLYALPTIFDTRDFDRVGNIIDSAVNHLEQNFLAGRNVSWYVRADEARKPVYRSVNGVAEELAPGEKIMSNEVFYSSPDLNPDSVIQLGHMGYFLSGSPTYAGSSEILWPIWNQILFDHSEANLGRAALLPKTRMAGSLPDENPDFVRIRHADVSDVVRTPADDLPDWEIVQTYKPIQENIWDRVVKTGFGRVIGPWIDALARKPIAFHAFALAAERNTANIQWLVRNTPQQDALNRLIESVMPANYVGATSEWVDRYGELGRFVGVMHGDPDASKWRNTEAIAYLRGSIADDERLLTNLYESVERIRNDQILTIVDKPMVDALIQMPTMKNRLGATVTFLNNRPGSLQVIMDVKSNENFIDMVDRIFGIGSARAGYPAEMVDGIAQRRNLNNVFQLLTDDEKNLYIALSKKIQGSRTGWDVLSDAAKQWDSASEEVYKYAAEHAIRDLMPFVDSHEIRSQFADTVSGLLPFWYAEENFLKRWARMFSDGGPAVTLARIRKLQLGYLGLRTMGVIRQDPQGKQYFVWPGSGAVNEIIQRAFGVDLPLTTVWQSPVERVVPGFTPTFGAPQGGPFVSVPLGIVSSIYPEIEPLERSILGDQSITRSVIDQIVPAQVRNTYNAITAFASTDPNGSSSRQSAAMMSAMVQLELAGYGLADDATAGEKDEYLRMLRDWSRVILLSQALGGWFMPAQLSSLTTDQSSLSWLTDGAIQNPAEILSDQYYELIGNLGIEEGTIAYLEMNPGTNIKETLAKLAPTVSKSTSSSGAPLPSTEDGIQFYLQNQELLDQYPEAGPWLLPQDLAQDSKRSQYAYDSEVIAGLRTRRTPEEFLDQMKYKEGAAVYFATQAEYERTVEQYKEVGATGAARQLKTDWEIWSAEWRASHPIFAEGLVSGEARARRRRIIDQMRYLIDDPEAPKASHFEALKSLQNSFDAYMAARSYLAMNQTAAGQAQLNALKVQFNGWVNEFVLVNPMIQSYWQTVLSPEAGLD